MPTTKEAPTTSPIGRDTPRVDGPLKVTGTAHYASDFHFPGLLYGVPVEATDGVGEPVFDTGAADVAVSSAAATTAVDEPAAAAAPPADGPPADAPIRPVAAPAAVKVSRSRKRADDSV